MLPLEGHVAPVWRLGLNQLASGSVQFGLDALIVSSSGFDPLWGMNAAWSTSTRTSQLGQLV